MNENKRTIKAKRWVVEYLEAETNEQNEQAFAFALPSEQWTVVGRKIEYPSVFGVEVVK